MWHGDDDIQWLVQKIMLYEVINLLNTDEDLCILKKKFCILPKVNITEIKKIISIRKTFF